MRPQPEAPGSTQAAPQATCAITSPLLCPHSTLPSQSLPCPHFQDPGEEAGGRRRHLVVRAQDGGWKQVAGEDQHQPSPVGLISKASAPRDSPPTAGALVPPSRAFLRHLGWLRSCQLPAAQLQGPCAGFPADAQAGEQMANDKQGAAQCPGTGAGLQGSR